METKNLSIGQMEGIEGGNCAMSVISVAASALGAGISLASGQVWGVALGVAGIYSGTPAVVKNCGGSPE